MIVRRCRAERGSITPFALIVSVGILLLAGLVIDGGRQMNGHGRAVSYAQEAARAGANMLGDDVDYDIDPALAVSAANQYCRQAMADDASLVSCRASITEFEGERGTLRGVEVTAKVEIDTILLSMVGMQSLSGSGSALAQPVPGIREALDDRQNDAAPPSVAPPSDEVPPPAGSEPPITVEPCPTVTPDPPKPKNDKGKGGKGKGGKGKGGKGKDKGTGNKPEPAEPTVSCPPAEGD